MYAVEILPKCLSKAFVPMHASRAQSLLGAVSALLSGRRLTLMGLARSYPDASRVRAPLKRLDRLLGNEHLEAEQHLLYEAMSRWLLSTAQPVIAIDWSPLDGHDRFQLLRAGVVLEGRTLTLLQEVHPTALLGNRKIERAFLAQLKHLMPEGVSPIILTDAGFRTPWFAAVRALGWDYIGRLRGSINIRFANETARQSSVRFSPQRLVSQSHWERLSSSCGALGNARWCVAANPTRDASCSPSAASRVAPAAVAKRSGAPANRACW